MLFRQVSALTNTDQTIVIKFEKGERKPSRERVFKFAEIYNIPEKDLIISWQIDKVAYDLMQENDAEEVFESC